MTRFADETPDVDEVDPDEDWMTREDTHANGHCRRCGIHGHHDTNCPTITPLLLRNET